MTKDNQNMQKNKKELTKQCQNIFTGVKRVSLKKQLETVFQSEMDNQKYSWQ